VDKQVVLVLHAEFLVECPEIQTFSSCPPEGHAGSRKEMVSSVEDDLVGHVQFLEDLMKLPVILDLFFVSLQWSESKTQFN